MLVEVKQIIRKLYVEHDNKLVEVKQIQDTSAYDEKTVIYHKQAVKGANKGSDLYAVSIDDYKGRTPRKSTSDKIAEYKAQGMSDAQIVAMLLQ